MYIFKANYINMKKDIEFSKKIEIDENIGVFENECEIYAEAMIKAYAELEKNNDLMFSSLEFIAC